MQNQNHCSTVQGIRHNKGTLHWRHSWGSNWWKVRKSAKCIRMSFSRRILPWKRSCKNCSAKTRDFEFSNMMLAISVGIHSDPSLANYSSLSPEKLKSWPSQSTLKSPDYFSTTAHIPNCLHYSVKIAKFQTWLWSVKPFIPHHLSKL